MSLEPEPVKVPQLIRTERTAPDFGITTGPQPIEAAEFKDSDLLAQIASVAEDQLKGEIPEDVQQELQQITAEKGISTGVMGQANEFSLAQALGLTSLDMQSAGVQTGLAVEGLRTQRELAEADIKVRTDMFNVEMDRTYAELQEEMRQWDDRFLAMEQGQELSESQLDLSAAQLISSNQQFLQGLVAEVMVANSKKEIKGIQEAVDTWSEYFGLTNSQIAELLGLDEKLGVV